MPLFTDQTGRTVSISPAPQRIISLVPSQTELLFHLGLEEKVVGITKFCIHPESWFHSKTRVGGTKQINVAIIDRLQPDLIVANKEENVKEQVVELVKQYPVWVSDVNNLDDALEMIEQIGLLTGTKEKAQEINTHIRTNFNSLDKSIPIIRTAYLIWRNPYMTVGGDTFIHAMLQQAGLENIYGECSRYPSITIEQLKEDKPDLLLLSSEPYPFRQNHIDELQAHLPHTKIMLVDGELFSWYGSRLLHSPAYFMNLRQQLK
jgi:ABC-type Fe3+-hydroxamate transport system substrate-binding protein